MDGTMFEEGFIEELQSQTASFSKATHETILLGCEGGESREGDDPRSWFFWWAGFKGSYKPRIVDPNSSKTPDEVHPSMSINDAVTIQCSYALKFLPGQLEKCDQKEIGGFLAKNVARNMLDEGIACLYGALTSVRTEAVFNRTSSTPKGAYLHERGDFSSHPYIWLAHSSPYFALIKEYGLYEHWPKPSFSFEGGGFVADLLTKRLVVRDSDFLLTSGNGKIDKYRIIGLYDGGIAVFLDGFNVEISSDICRFFWNQSTAVKGFAWKGNVDVRYNQLSTPDNWQTKTDNKDHWAGFIIETSAAK